MEVSRFELIVIVIVPETVAPSAGDVMDTTVGGLAIKADSFGVSDVSICPTAITENIDTMNMDAMTKPNCFLLNIFITPHISRFTSKLFII